MVQQQAAWQRLLPLPGSPSHPTILKDHLKGASYPVSPTHISVSPPFSRECLSGISPRGESDEAAACHICLKSKRESDGANPRSYDTLSLQSPTPPTLFPSASPRIERQNCDRQILLHSQAQSMTECNPERCDPSS
jgi:hypothetical protein